MLYAWLILVRRTRCAVNTDATSVRYTKSARTAAKRMTHSFSLIHFVHFKFGLLCFGVFGVSLSHRIVLTLASDSTELESAQLQNVNKLLNSAQCVYPSMHPLFVHFFYTYFCFAFHSRLFARVSQIICGTIN